MDEIKRGIWVWVRKQERQEDGDKINGGKERKIVKGRKKDRKK